MGLKGSDLAAKCHSGWLEDGRGARHKGQRHLPWKIPIYSLCAIESLGQISD